MKSELLDLPVGQLVAEHPSRSRVFEKWSIDYCCRGGKSLSEVCKSRQLNPDLIVQDLLEADSVSPRESEKWLEASLSSLCENIVEVHHRYLREELSRLSQLVDKVADRHGERDPRLLKLKQAFDEFRKDILGHVTCEEICLFPKLSQLHAPAPDPVLANHIREQFGDHEHVGAELAAMRDLTDNFTPNQSTCNTHRAMLAGLAELEQETHLHVHKENNILFPRALALVDPSEEGARCKAKIKSSFR